MSRKKTAHGKVKIHVVIKKTHRIIFMSLSEICYKKGK